MTSEEFDKAMCIYLGGPPDSEGIQIGHRDARLRLAYPLEFRQLKVKLDEVLALAVEWSENRHEHEGQTIYSWLATELPILSLTCRNKIAAYVIFNLEH